MPHRESVVDYWPLKRLESRGAQGSNIQPFNSIIGILLSRLGLNRHRAPDFLEEARIIIKGTKHDDLVDATHTVAGQPLPTDDPDTIFGDEGNDNLSGLGGDDIIVGGKGADIMDGGEGNDIIRVAGKDGTFDTFIGGNGTDILEITGSHTPSLAGFDATASSIELFICNGPMLKGTSGADMFDFSGLISANALTIVDAGKGDDTIIGSIIVEELRGGKGNDILDGGGGDDRLVGNKGNDIFKFANGGGADLVVDYKAGDDKFDFTDVAGVHNFGDLTLTQEDSHTVLVDFDGVAGGESLAIQKTTIATLNAHQSDFLFS